MIITETNMNVNSVLSIREQLTLESSKKYPGCTPRVGKYIDSKGFKYETKTGYTELFINDCNGSHHLLIAKGR